MSDQEEISLTQELVNFAPRPAIRRWYYLCETSFAWFHKAHSAVFVPSAEPSPYGHSTDARQMWVGELHGVRSEMLV